MTNICLFPKKIKYIFNSGKIPLDKLRLKK